MLEETAIIDDDPCDGQSADVCCPYTSDGECDEPQYCGAGTDNADCRGGVDRDTGSQNLHDFFFAAQSGVRYDVGVRASGNGVTSTSFWVLPPGATDTSQAVATQTTIAADMGLGFTAAATGDFTARVRAFEGSGPITLTATAVGTAEHRSPPLRADGRPHPLEVSCLRNNCAFGYDGASAYDGDGSGFDLVRDCFALAVVTCS